MKRLIDLTSKKVKKYTKKRIFFTPSTDPIQSNPINFYNQGCPVEQWKIDPDKLKRNTFKIFNTGDAFSVISPSIEINGTNIIIHVGTEHAHYSPLVLIQEALQLCRCASEHDARSITIALPETFHPLVHFNDFNSLILRFFKASGANKVFYYGADYTGKLDDSNLGSTINFPIAHQSQPETEVPATLISQKFDHGIPTLDQQIMHLNHEREFRHTWSKFNADKDLLEELIGKESVQDFNVPQIKVQPHILLCCSANKPLAEKIAANLRMRGEIVRLYSIEGEGELAKIPDEAAICGSIVTIVQSTRPNPDCIEKTQAYQKTGASSYFFEATMIARQAHLRGAEVVNLINPYQFSARSDKKEDHPKRGKTGAFVQQNGKMIAASGVNRLITAECHDGHTLSGAYTDETIKGAAVSAISVITTRLAEEWLNDSIHPMQGQIRLVTPDAGAAKRTQELVEILRTILGNKMSQTRVLGEKQRDSHNDDSALITSLNSGSGGINPNDTYVITDDETATGTTLCLAVKNLVQNGATNIVVVVVHNNMPLDWLERQSCLARFLYLGVNDIHFSDTHEMGTLAKSYDDLIAFYAQQSKLPTEKVEAQLFAWFKKEIADKFVDQSPNFINQEFIRFKSKFDQLGSKVRIHSLASEFAHKITSTPYMVNPYSFEYKVNGFVNAIKRSQAHSVVSVVDASLPAASAAAMELGLPLHVLPQVTSENQYSEFSLPKTNYALIGTPNEATMNALREHKNYKPESKADGETSNLDGDLVFISNEPNVAQSEEKTSPLEANTPIVESLSMVEELYHKIKSDPKLCNRPVKLLGIGIAGQVLAGQIGHLLNKTGKLIGIVAVDNHFISSFNSPISSGKTADETLHADKNSLGMGDVCIAVFKNGTLESRKSIQELTALAKVHCPYNLLVTNDGPRGMSVTCESNALSAHYNTNSGQLLFARNAQPSRATAPNLELRPEF